MFLIHGILFLEGSDHVEKLPPIAKVYEAYSAIADERVELKEQEAYVKSSDGAKTYTVRFSDQQYSSNDNATRWQHYAGYPILALLLMQKQLPLHKELLPYFKNINWKALNTRFHNQYDLAIQAFLSDKQEQANQIQTCMQECLEKCKDLDIVIKGNRAKLL